jgi:hypothetical protein
MSSTAAGFGALHAVLPFMLNGLFYLAALVISAMKRQITLRGSLTRKAWLALEILARLPLPLGEQLETTKPVDALRRIRSPRAGQYGSNKR